LGQVDTNNDGVVTDDEAMEAGQVNVNGLVAKRGEGAKERRGEERRGEERRGEERRGRGGS
jgi:hypothetical protein